jgi:hypothetical protein
MIFSLEAIEQLNYNNDTVIINQWYNIWRDGVVVKCKPTPEGRCRGELPTAMLSRFVPAARLKRCADVSGSSERSETCRVM